MKQLQRLLTGFLISSTLLVQKAIAADYNQYASTVLGIMIVIPHPAYIKESQPMPIWLIFAVFAFLFSIIYALSLRLPFFKKDSTKMDIDPANNIKRPLVAFAFSMSLITIFSSNIVEWIAKVAEIMSRLFVLAVLVVGIIIIWFMTLGSYKSSKDMYNEAATKESVSGKALHNAKREEHQAKDELNKQTMLLNREKKDIKKADSLLRTFNAEDKDEVHALREAEKILHHLVSVKNDASIGQLKQMLLRYLSSAMSLTKMEEGKINVYKHLENEMKTVEHHLFQGTTDIASLITKIEDHFNQVKGAAALSPAIQNRIRHIAQKGFLNYHKRHELLTHLNTEINKLGADDTQIGALIKDIIGDVYNNQFPPALQKIQEVIRKKEEMHHYERAMSQLEHRLRSIIDQTKIVNAELNSLLK